MPAASSTSAAAYLELHIEQGPVLESLDLPLGVVLGTFGVERHRVTWRGQAAHAGSTPMDKRRDALAGAAKLALEIRVIAARVGDGAVCTSGGVVCSPGIVTSVVETAEQLLDQRHLDAAKLASLLDQAQAASEHFAAEESIDVEWERIWSIEPILFDETLVGFCEEAIQDVAGTAHRLPSGPLHDAAEVSRAGVPTVMLFVQSLRGLSHTKLEDTQRGAPRARRRGTRSARVEDDRLGRSRRRTSRLTGLRPWSARAVAERSPTAVVAGLAVGGCLTWNVTNVGAVADPLAEHYGVSLAAIGLLTTALFVTHLAVQLPAGRGADRFGSQRVALVAIVAAVAGNAVLLVDGGFELALARTSDRRHRLGRGLRRRPRSRARRRRRRGVAGSLRRRDDGRRRAGAHGGAATHRRDELARSVLERDRARARLGRSDARGVRSPADRARR